MEVGLLVGLAPRTGLEKLPSPEESLREKDKTNGPAYSNDN